MDLVTKDIEIIREVRRLCLKHDFERATELAKKVADAHTRDTLLFICKSFKATQLHTHAA
jgi:hypothetical protein